MPELLRGVARTAVAAGTWTAVSNRVSRRQAERWSDQEAEREAPPPQAAAPAEEDPLEQLKKLGELKEAGILTDAEFEAQKAKILAG
jgi:membrane protease subunit (stomatin/prohibitin family)